MHWPKVRLILRREVFDQLRDRRTLFMLVILPMLLYPLLGFGMTQLTVRFGKNERRIGLVGVHELPGSPPLLDEKKERFHASLYKQPENQVYTRILPSDDWKVADLESRKIHVLVKIPKGSAQRLAQGEQVVIEVRRNGVDDDSMIAYRATVNRLDDWNEQIVKERMISLGKPEGFAKPIVVEEETSDIAQPEARAGAIWGRLFPFMLVLMALTGAFYPAVDLCAGEKERGTMETLLISPASRSEIVVGKFLAILLFSVTTTVVNLASMGMTLAQISTILPKQDDRMSEQFAAPSLLAIVSMLVLMLPLAAFFSALSMALAIFARSTKEGQYYLMPLFLIVMPLTFLTLAPGVELTTFFSLVPVTNVALLLRALLLHQYVAAGIYFFPVLAPTILYSVFALRFAISQFNREEVLFREAERFEPVLWARRLLRDKEPYPSVGETWLAFGIMLALLWHSQSMPIGLASIAIRQIGLIGFPAVVMSLLLTTDPRRTLLIRPPRLAPTLLAIVCVASVHPIAVGVANSLKDYVPDEPDLKAHLSSILNADWWTTVVVLAILPAICEELAFRGFILSGLRHKYGDVIAIAVSSLMFGLFHMVPLQTLTTALLGLLLGLIAIRTGSIFPSMAFHAIHNSALFWLYREHQESGADSADGFGYPAWILALAALATAGIVFALVRMKSDPDPAEDAVLPAP